MLKNKVPFFALFALLLLTACGVKNPESNYALFRFNEMGDVTSLDPAEARSFENVEIDNQLYNGLVAMSDSLRVVPAIAKSWTISNDGKIYTFHLRRDVFFQDDSIFPDGKGRRVTAMDFVHSFFRLFDARVSDASTLLEYVDRMYPHTIQGFYAANDSTFMIYLKEAYAPFLKILTMKYFSVVPIEAVDKYGQDFGEHPVGTGPFMCRRWVHGVKLVLVRNPHYFEKDKQGNSLPYLDGVVVTFLKSAETSFLQFLDGKLDMVSGIAAINPKEAFNNNNCQLRPELSKKFYVQRAPFIKTDYLGFMIDTSRQNVPPSPIQLKAVRQAINYGINRQDLVKYIRYGIGIPAINGFIPPFLPCCKHEKVKGYTYNPDKAYALLAQAGYPGGKGLPTIMLRVSSQWQPLAIAVQGQLRQVGIKIDVSGEQPAALAEGVASGEFYFFKKSWVGDYPSGANFLSLFYSKNFSPQGANYCHYSNPKFDKLYEQAIGESNDSVRYADYVKLDQMVTNDAPVVPLYYDEVIHIVNKRVTGLPVNSLNLLDLRYVKKPAGQ